MGANFTYRIVPIAKKTPERVMELIAIVDAISPQDFVDLEDECGTTRDGILSAITDYWNFRERRDVGELQLSDTIPFFISGGMTWGGGPTEAYDAMNVIGTVQSIWNKLEVWATEDIESVVV